MTLATFTLALALSATHAQVLPVPPVPPAESVMPAVPIMPAIPAIPPMPVIPDFVMPEIDLPDFASMPFIADGEMHLAMIEAEAALASMPHLAEVQGQLAGLGHDLADMGEFAGFPFDGHMLEAEIAGAGAAFSWDMQGRDGERERAAYERARASLDRRNWDDAAERFETVAAMKGDRVDAALYWKAYAQSRAGKTSEAQATIAALRGGYPKSRYLNDANALEVELKRGIGQQVSPEAQQDEDLKLLAIQGLQHSDPGQAIPLLEKILASSNSPRVKERALYVLALSNSPRAQEVLLGIAKGSANPDLQGRAIDYLAMHSRSGGRSALEEIYNSSTDTEVRQRVLRAYMSHGDRARLLAAAQNEQNEQLRMAAIRYLGSSGGSAELAQLYEKETSAAVRSQIVRNLGAAGAVDRLQHLARVEKDPEVRMQVIRAFAMAGRERTGTALQDMYATEATADGKRAIIRSLGAQGNAEALVAIARRETSAELKEYCVRQLSTMTKSKVALDYLMELLNK